jgi:dipeptidyl-peptidase-4
MRTRDTRAWLVLVALAFLALPSWAQKDLTVERIYGQPSLSGSQFRGIQWSPDGKTVSYEQVAGRGTEAVTEVWAMDVASGQRRALLRAEQIRVVVAQPLDGETLRATQATGGGRAARKRYEWAPDGRAMLYVATGNLYWFDLQTGKGKALTRGEKRVEDPKISPDGRWVSFVRDYDLWAVQVATGKERRITRGGSEEMRNGALDWVYPEELGITTAYWWSPDSQRIAYLQFNEAGVAKYPVVDFTSVTGETEFMRYPKAGGRNPEVSVYAVNVKGGRAQLLGATKGESYIPRVGWLPDGKRVAIQKLNRVQNQLDLFFVDTGSGRSELVLTEKDPHWINIGDELHFFADGKRFLWGSERDGFRHLYLYDMSGRLQRQVTQGKWEVTSLDGVDEKAGAIYFTATEKSPLERHLYRIGLEDATATRITREEGTYSVAMSPGQQHYVGTYSNAAAPSRQDVYRADGTRVQVLNENRVAELQEYELQAPEFFRVRGAGGTELHAMMIKPPRFDAARKYPVLLYQYGGPHGQVVRNQWGGSRFLWHQLMAQKGYIVFSLDNHGMAGRGHAFETPVHKRMGEMELADQLAGVKYLQSLPYVDGSRIGIWGWSYGGYMTLYAMFNAADVFKAGFAGAPVTAWENYDTIYTERYMSTPQENPEGYKQSAPRTHAAKLKGKLLIAHGTADDNVHYANTLQLQDDLIRAGKHVEIIAYPERGHGISDATAQIHLFRRVTQFFLDNL